MNPPKVNSEWKWTEIVGPYNSHKNGRLSYKNLEAMIGVTSLQLPKYSTKAIISIKARPIPPLEMGKRIVNKLGKPLDTSKNLTLRVSQILE
jgi:hypothetical protein